MSLTEATQWFARLTFWKLFGQHTIFLQSKSALCCATVRRMTCGHDASREDNKSGTARMICANMAGGSRRARFHLILICDIGWFKLGCLQPPLLPGVHQKRDCNVHPSAFHPEGPRLEEQRRGGLYTASNAVLQVSPYLDSLCIQRRKYPHQHEIRDPVCDRRRHPEQATVLQVLVCSSRQPRLVRW
jgi:hypothetical protein